MKPQQKGEDRHCKCHRGLSDGTPHAPSADQPPQTAVAARTVSRPASWPTRRDLLHVALGFAGLQLLRATVFGVGAFVGTLFDAFFIAFQR